MYKAFATPVGNCEFESFSSPIPSLLSSHSFRFHCTFVEQLHPKCQCQPAQRICVLYTHKRKCLRGFVMSHLEHVYDFLFLLLFLCSSIRDVEGSAKECTGANLDSSEKLRVGIKHRPQQCDRKCKKGDILSMHYEGRLYSNCTTFDSSRARDSPFTFAVGMHYLMTITHIGVIKRITIVLVVN